MAFGSQAAAIRVLILSLAAAPLVRAQTDLRLEVRHDHLWGHQSGTLLFHNWGVSYREDTTAKQRKKADRPHAWDWNYGDIQQLQLSPRRVRVLTYKDQPWKLGLDRGYEFDILPGQPVRQAYDFLKTRMDERFVAAVADASTQPAWGVRVKHLKRFGGTPGLLTIGSDQIVFTADKREASRTWRFSDIENISTSGPFQLTIVTHERALAHYGDAKQFNFQLKERLDEARYNELWRRLNESQGLEILLTSKEKKRNEENVSHSDGLRSAADRRGEESDLHGRDH